MIKFPLHIIHCGFSFSLYFNILCQMSVTYTRNLNCTGKITILIRTFNIKKKKEKEKEKKEDGGASFNNNNKEWDKP